MELERIEGKTFGDERVEIDGKHFVDCSFNGTTLIFNGGRYSFEGPLRWVAPSIEFSPRATAPDCIQILSFFGFLRVNAVSADGSLISAATISSVIPYPEGADPRSMSHVAIGYAGIRH